jgi:hypothetical protein
VAAVLRAREHARELELADPLRRGLQRLGGLLRERLVLGGQLSRGLGVVERARLPPVLRDGLLGLGLLLEQGLRPLLLRPEGGLAAQVLDLGDAVLLALDVKDAPGARRGARGAR